MNTIRSIVAATALSLLLPTVSMAQPGRGGDDRPSQGRDNRGDGPRRDGPPQREAAHDRRDDRHDARNDRRDDRRDMHDDRGAGPDHAFHRGGRLPPDYRSRQYVVDDWRGHRLSAPPRGYHWVQTGADYLLVAVATGLIAQVLLGN